MNLLNITKHILYLVENEYDFENSPTTADEIFAAERLFQVLKSFKDTCFSELYIRHAPSPNFPGSVIPGTGNPGSHNHIYIFTSPIFC